MLRCNVLEWNRANGTALEKDTIRPKNLMQKLRFGLEFSQTTVFKPESVKIGVCPGGEILVLSKISLDFPSKATHWFYRDVEFNQIPVESARFKANWADCSIRIRLPRCHMMGRPWWNREEHGLGPWWKRKAQRTSHKKGNKLATLQTWEVGLYVHRVKGNND